MPGYTKSVAVTAPAYQGEGQEMAVAWNRATFATGEMTLNAVYPMVRLPRGAVVHDVVFTTGDLDTGAACILSVGVAGDTERYVRRVSGQAAGTFRAGNDATAAASILAAAPLAAETTVDVLFQTAPGTAQAGSMQIAVYYTCE
jgi:hypothetical protein